MQLTLAERLAHQLRMLVIWIVTTSIVAAALFLTFNVIMLTFRGGQWLYENLYKSSW